MTVLWLCYTIINALDLWSHKTTPHTSLMIGCDGAMTASMDGQYQICTDFLLFNCVLGYVLTTHNLVKLRITFLKG